MGRFRRNGRLAGGSPKLLGNAATMERGEESAWEQRGKEKKTKPMPAVERLGRASSLLSACFGAAAPEEIKKRPGSVVLDGDKSRLRINENINNILGLNAELLEGGNHKQKKTFSFFTQFFTSKLIGTSFGDCQQQPAMWTGL